VDAEEVMALLETEASADYRTGLLERYGVPNEHALGVPMGKLKRIAKDLGTSHALAAELWATGVYEARLLAAFVEEPDDVTEAQMDLWVRDFDSWAICDTVCFSLFDKLPFAWKKTAEWAKEPEEFVRRAGFALVWALTTHDKAAPDARFLGALELIEAAEPDKRPLVKKAIDMALRAIGKRNARLNREAIAVAERMAISDKKDRAWIGRHALRELGSAKVQGRLAGRG